MFVFDFTFVINFDFFCAMKFQQGDNNGYDYSLQPSPIAGLESQLGNSLSVWFFLMETFKYATEVK